MALPPSSLQPRAVPVQAWRPDRGPFEDHVAAEEPLEIRVDGSSYAVTLRTPGDDEELAAGFAVTEGIVARAQDIVRVVRVDDVPDSARGNVLDVQLAPQRGAVRERGRPRLVTSSCGACGDGTIEFASRRAAPLPGGAAVEASRLVSLPSRLLAAQAVFAETGGLHAAGLFEFDGTLVVAREDVGRHNAVDKVIGWAALRGELPLSNRMLFVSGRAGFEIVLKAWVAGVPVMASVSAPSHLAVQLATEANMTLVGFVRNSSYTIYAARERIRTA